MNDIPTGGLDRDEIASVAGARVPVVTVIMSVYNDAAFLPEAIDSILSQSMRDFEFVIINDGSTDASQQIIESYHDTRIVALAQAHQGLTKLLNKALGIARGQYIARQDADDVSLPERLAKQVEFLDTHQDVVVVGTSIILINKRGQRMRDYIYPSDHVTLCQRLLTFGNPFPHSTVMFRRDVAMAVGGYDELFYKAQDYALILRLIEHHCVASIQEPLVKLRMRTDSLWPLFFERFEKWFASSYLRDQFSASKFRRMAVLRWYQQDYLGALHRLLQALLCDPHWLWERWRFRRIKQWNQNIEKLVKEMMRICADT